MGPQPTPQGQSVQVIVQQARGNSAATLALFCVALGVITCCIPIVPWVFAFLAIGFALLGILVSLTRGGTGLLYSIAALVLGFLPMLPAILLGGLFVAAPAAVERAREAAERVERQQAASSSAEAAAPAVEPAIPMATPAAPPATDAPAKETIPDQADSTIQEPDAPDVTPDPPSTTFRAWTDATGKFTIEAEYKGVLQGVVSLKKKDGTTIKLPLERLSEVDRKWIADRAKRW